MLFGLNVSPFILTATIWNHLSKFIDKGKETIDNVESSLYVNDLCAGGFDDDGTQKIMSALQSEKVEIQL